MCQSHISKGKDSPYAEASCPIFGERLSDSYLMPHGGTFEERHQISGDKLAYGKYGRFSGFAGSQDLVNIFHELFRI